MTTLSHMHNDRILQRCERDHLSPVATTALSDLRSVVERTMVSSMNRISLISMILVCRISSEGAHSFVLAPVTERATPRLGSACRSRCAASHRGEWCASGNFELTLYPGRASDRLQMAAIEEEEATRTAAKKEEKKSSKPAAEGLIGAGVVNGGMANETMECHACSTSIPPAARDCPVVTGTPQLLVASGLTNTFDGTRYQFQDLDLTVCRGQKLGLIGVNGCGKSTLLKVLGGKEKCESGLVESPKATLITYVDQDPDFPEGFTVRDAVFAADNPLMRAVREYQEATNAIDAAGSSADAMAKASERFERATATMETVGGWDAETFALQVMSRLNVKNLQNKLVSALSGGQRKRVALAAALIQKPDVLLLDEPTNHLDVDATDWLEKLLADRSLTFVCVTHDRYFLENVCQEIIELDAAKLYRYQGSYEYFLEMKEERLNAEGTARESARTKLKGELAWMRKQPKARQAKSKARQERFYELQAKAAVPASAKLRGLALSAGTTRLGKSVAHLKGASLHFSSKILDKFYYEFDRGDRIGIVGGNGVGKTTFLNVLMGLQPLDSGEVVTGETVRYGYYEQGGLVKLPEDVRVLEFVEDTCAGAPTDYGETPVAPQVAARRLLNLFQFPAARWNDRVGRLSGGEKRRLQLLQVLAKRPNFLVLDEPTNDLDILSLQVLEDFLLNDYKGCLIIVSHDRFFMDKVAKHLFLFEGSGVVRDFEGTFSDYLEYRREYLKRAGSDDIGSPKPRSKEPEAIPIPAASASGSRVEAPASSSGAVADSNKTERKLTNKERYEFARLEKDIDVLDTTTKELEGQLSRAQADGKSYSEMTGLMEDLSKAMRDLDAKTERWMELAELQ